MQTKMQFDTNSKTNLLYAEANDRVNDKKNTMKPIKLFNYVNL